MAGNVPGERFVVQARAVAGGAGLCADHAQAFASGASAEGAIEAEAAGIRIGENAVAGRTFQARGEFEAVPGSGVDGRYGGRYRRDRFHTAIAESDRTAGALANSGFGGGDKEAAARTGAVRRRGAGQGEEERGVTLDDLIARLIEERDTKALPRDLIRPEPDARSEVLGG